MLLPDAAAVAASGGDGTDRQPPERRMGGGAPPAHAPQPAAGNAPPEATDPSRTEESMINPLWSKIIKACPDPQRARHFWEILMTTAPGEKLAETTEAQAQLLALVLSASPALGGLLVANPQWLAGLDLEHLRHPRRPQGLRQEIDGLLQPLLTTRNYRDALRELRGFKQAQMLRIAARDLARLGTTAEIVQEISDVADLCLEFAWRLCEQQGREQLGQPYHQDAAGRWQPTPACVLGLGKLGGQELNYSSDVDLLFVYGEEGQVFPTPPGKARKPASRLSNHQFFNRLAEAFIAAVSPMTEDGTLFRIDLRLRPEGNTGPVCRSLASYENYYSQWGQTWERMMLIKARGVAGDGSLAAEFLEMIQPFRFPRAVHPGVRREIAAMKARIERELLDVEAREYNVKLGRGGIREIEFIVQAQQLVDAGRLPFLQSAQTLRCLDKLVQYHRLAAREAEQLQSAYVFLRDVEHRLQMDENLQTHTIPPDRPARERLARLMGFATWRDFETARQTHCRNVRRVFDDLFGDEPAPPASPFPPEFDGAEAEWKALLTRHGFRDVDKSLRTLREFVQGPGFVHVSARTLELARGLLPRLFTLCRTDEGQGADRELPPKTLSDPDRVLTRLDNFIAVYGARAALFELWHNNPNFFELLLLLFDRSEFLAEALIRSPELLDDLVYGGRLNVRKTAPEILRDLRHGLKDEDQYVWLRRYHEAELTRLGLRDILGLADFEQNLGELSALADACLQYALEVIMRRHRLKTPPFVIVGLGKLGGREINYGSDLDLLFVADVPLPQLPSRQRLAVEFMDLVSRRTDHGTTFQTDARLRPDGEKGLLVNTLAAYEAYYLKRAQLWEIQSLTRTRPVAGDPQLGARFQQLAARMTNFATLAATAPRRPAAGLPACATPDWKSRMHDMRMRIEKERTPAGQEALAIKTGQGGLMDAEFIAQALCLEHGWQEAHTLRALERAAAAGLLPEAGKLLENYRQLRRVESILRRWSYAGETVLPSDPEPYERVAVRCGFAAPTAFAAALAHWRAAVREVYEIYFQRNHARTPPPERH